MRTHRAFPPSIRRRERTRWSKEALARSFREFRPYLGQCRFVGCAHVKEQGCAVLAARDAGKIVPSRHESYVRLYELARENKPLGKN